MAAAISIIETFEDVLALHERRIHFHIHRLRIRDPHQEFYQEGVVAMWQAYKSYQLNKGDFSTYLNCAIRNRLIDLIRKRVRDDEHTVLIEQGYKVIQESGNYVGRAGRSQVLYDGNGLDVDDGSFWNQIRDLLSENQWKWVCLYIVEGLSLKEIAAQECVSVDAVKSWGREVRKKLRGLEVEFLAF